MKFTNQSGFKMGETFLDQVIVISGGADGIGLAIARLLGKKGGRLALFDINKEKLDHALDSISDIQTESHGWCLDISMEAQVKSAFEEVVQKFGRIDVMINSAGIVGLTSTSIVDYPVEEFDKAYQVNLRGAFLMSKYALLHMSRNNYGRILLIASIAGKEGNPFMAGYSATKSGVIGLVKGLGKEFATKGITVNGLAPAVIETPMNADTDPAQLEYMTSKIPMGRLGTTLEVAEMSSFIVSKENSFSTGFIYDISGGRATY